MEERWSRVTSWVALAALLGTGVWGYNQYQQRVRLENALQNRYLMAYNQLVDHVENSQVLLAKSKVAASPKQTAVVFSDMWYHATAAQDSLTQLPLASNVFTKTSKFLNQLGDYAYVVNRANAEGRELSPAERERLTALYTQCNNLSAELHNIQDGIYDGRVRFNEFKQEVREGIGQEGKDLKPVGFEAVDKEMSQMPVMIYDGPFSDHLERRKPRALTGPRVTLAKAKSNVQGFIDNKAGLVWSVRSSGAEVANKVASGETKGKIPAYSLELLPGGRDGGDRVLADVSKKGGHVVWYLNTRSVNNASLDIEEAVEVGKNFLRSRGFADMVPTYALKQDNVGVITFGYSQEGVIVYADLIKLQVALDNGEVIGFDSTGYLMSHTKRQLPQVKVSKEQAQAQIKDYLPEIEYTRLAYIPTDAMEELLCWEIAGKVDGQQYITYINAVTGEQEKILQIIDSEAGKLTM